MQHLRESPPPVRLAEIPGSLEAKMGGSYSEPPPLARCGLSVQNSSWASSPSSPWDNLARRANTAIPLRGLGKTEGQRQAWTQDAPVRSPALRPAAPSGDRLWQAGVSVLPSRRSRCQSRPPPPLPLELLSLITGPDKVTGTVSAEGSHQLLCSAFSKLWHWHEKRGESWQVGRGGEEIGDVRGLRKCADQSFARSWDALNFPHHDTSLPQITQQAHWLSIAVHCGSECREELQERMSRGRGRGGGSWEGELRISPPPGRL